MTNLTLRLPEPPSANRYWRRSGVRIHLAPAAIAYRKDVYGAYVRQVGHCRMLFPKGPVLVSLAWHRGRKAGDLDNRIKQVLDALRGVAYADDGQVSAIHAYRYESPRNPYCVLTLSNG